MPRQMSWGACEQAFGQAENWGEGKRKWSAVDLFVPQAAQARNMSIGEPRQVLVALYKGLERKPFT